MSIITIKSNEAKIGFSFDRRQEFLLDSVDDFYNLPFDCAPGSKAYLADNSRCWMMGGELEWVECVIVTGDSGIVPADVLRYTHQVLNSDQKSQARNNIDAASTEDVEGFYEKLSDKENAMAIVDIADSAEIMLKNDAVYRASCAVASLTIVLPETIDADYRCAIDFGCGDAATTLVYPDSIVWTGDSLDANGLFVPLHSHRYHIDIWFDGLCVRANASGVVM